MKPRHAILTALALLWSAAALPAAAPPPWSPGAQGMPRKNILYINGIPDTSSYFLPDTTVLARVNARVIRASEFIETYFASYAEDRPSSDSAGRAEWLHSMVNKEVMGSIAGRANYTFGYEERLVMREHTQRVLSNVLYQRAVADSVDVRDDEAWKRYQRLKTEYHLRHILLADSVLAERVRRDLGAGRITWKDASTRYSVAQDDSGPAGDLGWRTQAVETDDTPIFALEPGGISAVMPDLAGFQIVQLVARRAVAPPAWEGMRMFIRGKLSERQVQARSERLLAILREHSGMQYDTANILWASSRFRPEEPRNPVDLNIRLFPRLPVIAARDTARVLARWRDGRLKLGEFLHAYSDLPPLRRPNIHTPQGFRNLMDAFTLEPYKAQMAVDRGLDKDSLAVALIGKKREQLMVERMYQDSVESKVYISPEARRKYYKEHIAQFMTYPSVRYAILARPDSIAAHALAARLKQGEKAEDVQRADSLAGASSKLRVESLEGGGAFHALLFEVLKPGQLEITGPDQKGHYAVVQSLAYDAGRQLSFAESEQYADQNLRTQLAEEMLERFLARHSRGFHIESHPELVMRVRLVDAAALL